MSKLRDKKKIGFMMLLFASIYFTSYISRINFGAVMHAMAGGGSFRETELALAVTTAFVTYGAGQLVSGVLGDRINPKFLMFFGLLLTASMNAIIPFCPDGSYMIGVWAVNGFAQAFMWPPLVKIMTMLFDDETYRTATVRVSWGSSAGTIAVYLIAPICISTVGWQGSFYVPAIACAVMAPLWLFALRNTDTSVSVKKKERDETVENKSNPFGVVGIIAIIIGIVAQGALRDGITTWLPKFVNDKFNLGESISVLSGVVLPLFSIACFNITLKLRNNKVKDELLLAGYIFVVGAIAAVLLYFVSEWNPIISIILMAILTGSMHGVNLLLVCMVPSYFAKASTASGVLNAFTYVGSAISIYGIAYLKEAFGWNMTILTWIALAGLGTVVCFAAQKLRNRTRSIQQ